MTVPDRDPTVYDVAALAGVSAATVSRAITGSARVSPEAIARVRVAVGQLGYTRQRSAPARSREIAVRVADPDLWLLPAPTDQANTWGWAAATLAAFRIASQANLAASSTERTARPERRRTQRAGLPERDVRVVRLRRGESGGGPAGEASREYHHRWVVRGHWRHQPWGPRGSLRRPVWILPHVKGPEGAPLIGGDKVTVVGAPQQPEAQDG